MKAILKYDLESIDDTLALNRSFKSLDMASVLFEIIYNLKKRCMFELDSLEADSDKYDGMKVCLRIIGELIEGHNINIDELIQ